MSIEIKLLLLSVKAQRPQHRILGRVRTIFLELLAAPILLLILMSVGLELGVLLQRRHSGSKPDNEGLGVVDGAMFGLMGLLLAFSFSGAAQRFDERRALVTAEANAIGTAWLRLDLLLPEDQPALRDKLREYTDLRLETSSSMTTLEAAKQHLDEAERVQKEIWSLAVESAKQTPNPLAALALSSINEMFDIVTARTGALMKHPPGQLYALLFTVLVLCSVLAGYRMGDSAQWKKLHKISFVLIITITYYFIIDLEHPRIGLMRINTIDELLIQVRASMN